MAFLILDDRSKSRTFQKLDCFFIKMTSVYMYKATQLMVRVSVIAEMDAKCGMFNVIFVMLKLSSYNR